MKIRYILLIVGIVFLLVGIGIYYWWNTDKAVMTRCLLDLYECEESEHVQEYDQIKKIWDWHYICEDHPNVYTTFSNEELCLCNPNIDNNICEKLL